MILTHTYKLGGAYKDCVNISYMYSNNSPVRVKIPHLLYEPECSIDSNLEKGSGTERMIKAAIRYAYNDVPSLPIFEFEDNSHIDCVPKNMLESPPRKPIKPLNLAFFSIAYNGSTWYELRFNATMSNTEKYAEYKERLSFLTDPLAKLPFIEFLHSIAISMDSVEQISYLEPLYISTNTYRDFLKAIPKDKRCDILAPWLHTFMKHYIGDVFSHTGWQIDVRTMDFKSGGKRKEKRRSRKIGSHYRIFNWEERHNV